MLICSGTGTSVDLHHFLFGLRFFLKVLNKYACVALADQALKGFKGTLFKKFSDITLDRSLSVELTLLGEVYGRFDV
jgi:hypothetical protein